MVESFKICGLNKSEIENKLKDYKCSGISYIVKEKYLDATITIDATLDKNKFDLLKSKIYNLFEDYVYSAYDDSLQNIAVKLLKMNGRMLAVAESLTGGEIASMLTEVPGVSENFYEGIVCYNKESKIKRLDVPRYIINETGTVSRETAVAMVKGLNKTPVDICLATTGLAGPSGDEGKPVGLVYIAVGGGDFIPVFERHFTGDRNTIRHSVSNVALFYLIRYLKGDILRL